MTEGQAILQRPRSRAELASELHEAHTYRTALVELAAEYLALDCRPIVVIDGQVEPRNLSDILPDELTIALYEASEAIHELHYELATGERLTR